VRERWRLRLKNEMDLLWPQSRPQRHDRDRWLISTARELNEAVDAAQTVTDPDLKAECVESIKRKVSLIEERLTIWGLDEVVSAARERLAA
jgi:hypothetical protein